MISLLDDLRCLIVPRVAEFIETLETRGVLLYL